MTLAAERRAPVTLLLILLALLIGVIANVLLTGGARLLVLGETLDDALAGLGLVGSSNLLFRRSMLGVRDIV